MNYILCLISLHSWEHYTSFLADKHWNKVDWARFPEWWCPCCGKEKYKNTVEIITF